MFELGGAIRMKWRWPWLVLVVALGAALAVSAVILLPLLRQVPPPVLELPTDEEVVELRASLWSNQLDFLRASEFTVPADRVPLVMRWLRPADYVAKPPIFLDRDELGELRIRVRDGREL